MELKCGICGGTEFDIYTDTHSLVSEMEDVEVLHLRCKGCQNIEDRLVKYFNVRDWGIREAVRILTENKIPVPDGNGATDEQTWHKYLTKGVEQW